MDDEVNVVLCADEVDISQVENQDMDILILLGGAFHSRKLVLVKMEDKYVLKDLRNRVAIMFFEKEEGEWKITKIKK